MGLPNLEMANINAQSVEENGFLNFGLITRKQNQNGLPTPTFETTNNSSSITLNQQGYYHINVNAICSAPTIGNVAMQLYSNGVPIAQAKAEETIGTADTENHTLGFSVILRVFGNCGATTPLVLTLVNTGIGADYSLTNIDVMKISK